MRVVILQPFYLPYTGVFELVRLADTFVLYDDVQYSKGGWMNRNRVRTNGDRSWLTVPVKASNTSLITEVLIDNTQDWAAKHEQAFAMGYSRAPHVDEVLSSLSMIWDDPPDRLVDLNLMTFDRLCDLVGVSADFLRSSELGIGGSSTERLVDICRELGASEYLSGPAARDYLDEGAFTAADIELTYHRFDHPVWPQVHGDDFVDYLSVTDAIANIGGTATGELIEGCGTPVPAQSWEP